MYTFRYNPVVEAWVLLGEPRPKTQEIKPAHLVDPQTEANFLVANLPLSPFVLDPDQNGGFKGVPSERVVTNSSLLFPEQAPVGEYELLLYQGQKGFYDFGPKEWEEWMLLVVNRVWAFHKNPHLHYLGLRLHTSALLSLGGQYLRVGDLICTKERLIGLGHTLEAQLAHKLRQKEDRLGIHYPGVATVYANSAPTQIQELWLLPEHLHPNFDSLDGRGRKGIAKLLSKLMPLLHQEMPQSEWVIELHSAMSGMEPTSTWWIQIFEEPAGNQNVPNSYLALKPLPEAFWQKLKHKLPQTI